MIIDPFPFDTDPASFTLVRRTVLKSNGSGTGAAREFFALEPETVSIVMQGD